MGNKTEPRPYTWTDQGNSERMFDMFGDKIRYVAGWSKWVVYSNGRWQFDNENRIGQWAVEVVETMAKEAQEQQERTKAVQDDTERAKQERLDTKFGQWIQSVAV